MKVLHSCLVICVILAGCSRRPETEPGKAAAKSVEPTPVRVVPAETRKVDKAIFVTGSLLPDETVTVSAEVAGRVSAIFADFGQNVRKGQVLAELDKREFSLQLERSRAALAQALARVGLSPGQEDQLPKTSPAVRQAEAQFEDARFKFLSASKLVKSGDISQERFTEVEKMYYARQAALDASRDELRTQLANIQALRAEVQLAEKRLSDATLRAPFDGAVTARSASAGQFMKENTPILTVVKTFPLRLRVEIPEAAASEVRVGSSLTFTADGAPGVEFHAGIRELNPSIDSRSRSLTAEARSSVNDPRLRPGMFVQVRLVVARDVEIVVVPKSAIHNVAGLTKVFVIHDGKVVEHRIPPGREIGDWVEVPDKIRPGEAVAVSNLGALVDGLSVKASRSEGSKG
jgi:RND family efflux transporter MFP subunit